MTRATYNPLTLPLLLERVKRSADLLRRPQPDCRTAISIPSSGKESRRLTENGGVESIEVGNQDRRGEHEQQEMPEEQITTPQRELDNLDHELSRGLRHDVRAQPTSVPSSSPPCLVGLVVLELARQEHSNEDLVDGPLDGDDGDEAQDGMRCIPTLEIPLEGQMSDVMKSENKNINDLPGTRSSQPFQGHRDRGRQRP